MSVAEVELGEFAVSRGGSVDPRKRPNETFELYSIPAFDDGKPEIVQGAEIGSSKKIVQPGDVLLSRLVPHIRRSWVVNDYTGNDQIASGEWIVFRTSDVDAEYLKRFLTSNAFHPQFMATVSGVGGSLLRARPEYVYKIKIPLPPLEEQKRIAAILDKADAIRRKRQQTVELTDQLLRSVFQDMFGDPVTNPKRWPEHKLEALCVDKHGVKAGPFGSALKKEDYSESGYRIYGQEQVLARTLSIGDYFIDEAKYQKLKSCAVKSGDILVSLVGSIGRTLVVPRDFAPGIINPRLVRLRPNSELLSSYYLQALFKQERFQLLLSGHSHGGTMPILNAGILRKLVIPLPPSDIQEAFLNIKSEVDGVSNRMFDSEQLSLAMSASLAQRAFSGKSRANG